MEQVREKVSQSRKLVRDKLGILYRGSLSEVSSVTSPNLAERSERRSGIVDKTR
jgi:hypothetical protein